MTHKLSDASMKALLDDAVAGNTAAVQAYAAAITAGGQFAHLDTPQAREALTAWQARQAQQDNAPFATAEEVAAFVAASMAGNSPR